MPDFEIKGDPGEIRSRAGGMVKKADLFSNTGTALGEIDSSGGWFGKAADKFHDKHEQEPPRWWAAGGGFRKAGAALETYAAALEGAKADAKWAEGEYQRGLDATKEAEAAYADYTSRYNKAKSDALAMDLAYPYPKEPYVDPGAEIREGALEALEQARRSRAAAARICAAQVREACRNAPQKQNFLDHALDVAKGLGDVAKDQAKMALVTTTFGLSETVPDLVRVLTGDLSIEEQGMKGRLDYEKIGDLKAAFSKDPKGFMEQLGKGMADWDTWADDPYRAAGRLIPDIVMSILSGGTAGSASKGLRTAAKVAEMLGDVGGSASTLRRAAGGVDDLGAAINIFEKLGKGSGPVHLPDVPTSDPQRGIPSVPDASTAPGTTTPSDTTPTTPTAPTAPDRVSEPDHRPTTTTPEPPRRPEHMPAFEGADAMPAAAGDSSPSAPSAFSALESRLGSLPDTSPSHLDSGLGGADSAGAPTPVPDPTPQSGPASHLDESQGTTSTADDVPSHAEGVTQNPDTAPVDDAAAGHPSDSVSDGPDAHDAETPDDASHPAEDPRLAEDHVKPGEGPTAETHPHTADYSGEGYQSINPYLRGEGSWLSPEDADADVAAINRELDSLPPHHGVTHRGMYIEETKLNELFGGKTFSDPAFLSTSHSEAWARGRAEDLAEYPADGHVKAMVRVEGHTGRDISSISQQIGEQEVLFKPGSQFDIIDKRWNAADQTWEINLREVGQPEAPPHTDLGGHEPGGVPSSHEPGQDAPSDNVDDVDTQDATPVDSPNEWGTAQHDPILDDAQLPHLAEPESLEESIERVNKLGRWADAGRFGNNCHNVVEALELRARGYDVSAAPTVESISWKQAADGSGTMSQSFEGRHLVNIADDWRQADGSTRSFDYLSDHGTESPTKALQAYTEDMPTGSRGFIAGPWENGNSHLLSFLKEADGSISVFDGQKGLGDAADRLDEMRFNQRDQQAWADIRVMRVDDLQPTSEVLHAVRSKSEAFDQTVSWGEAIRSGDPTRLPPEMVQREVAANEHWRERNNALIEKLEGRVNDPGSTPAQLREAKGMIDALQNQNRRLEWGLYNFQKRIHDARYGVTDA